LFGFHDLLLVFERLVCTRLKDIACLCTKDLLEKHHSFKPRNLCRDIVVEPDYFFDTLQLDSVQWIERQKHPPLPEFITQRKRIMVVTLFTDHQADRDDLEQASGIFPVLPWNAIDICRTSAHFYFGKEDNPTPFNPEAIHVHLHNPSHRHRHQGLR
jgi:hypothetical protein